MLKEGPYKVDFSSSLPGLPGQVDLRNGKIIGSDVGYRYDGTYVIEGQMIYAELFAYRESAVLALNVFQDTQAVHLKLSGDLRYTPLKVMGVREGTGEIFQAVLTPIPV